MDDGYFFDEYFFFVPDRLIWEHMGELLDGNFFAYELACEARERKESLE